MRRKRSKTVKLQSVEREAGLGFFEPPFGSSEDAMGEVRTFVALNLSANNKVNASYVVMCRLNLRSSCMNGCSVSKRQPLHGRSFLSSLNSKREG